MTHDPGIQRSKFKQHLDDTELDKDEQRATVITSEITSDQLKEVNKLNMLRCCYAVH